MYHKPIMAKAGNHGRFDPQLKSWGYVFVDKIM
jgi:hypothetical protein